MYGGLRVTNKGIGEIIESQAHIKITPVKLHTNHIDAILKKGMSQQEVGSGQITIIATSPLSLFASVESNITFS